MKKTPRWNESKRKRIEALAKEEVEWFFGRMEGRVPDDASGDPDARCAAESIEKWLKSILTFHRGALSLRYAPKEWPARLADEYREWTSLVVRLECALHPSDGSRSVAALERASVERLLAWHRSACREKGLGDLVTRANGHVRLAIRAYTNVRGDGPSVLPGPSSTGESR